jgi:hypothetical protein
MSGQIPWTDEQSEAPCARPKQRALFAAAAVAIAVAVLAGDIVAARHGGTESADRGSVRRPSSWGTPSITRTQQVTYRRLAVTVPASWTLNNARCGSPQGNTVLLPIGTSACRMTRATGITWIELRPSGVGVPPIQDAHSNHVTVDRNPATEVTGRVEGYAVVLIDVPNARASAFVHAPDAATARRLAATIAVVQHDNHGCVSQLSYEPLTTVRAQSNPGTEQSLVPGYPSSMAVCDYTGDLLTAGKEVAPSDFARDLALLRALPRGFSLAPARFNNARNCVDSTDLAASVDRDRRQWYTVLVRYGAAPILVLRARIGFCGYLGITNGVVSGQSGIALVHFLDTAPTGPEFPETVQPAPK